MANNQETAAAGQARQRPRHVRQVITTPIIRKLTILIPCFNEANTIALLLDKVTDARLPDNIDKEIIVVNDRSTDDSGTMIREYIEDNPLAPIKYLEHEINQGKGASIHTGIAHATGDYLIIQDADLEYNPHEYHLLLQPILSGNADIVYGSRFMGGQPHRILFFWHVAGNRLLTLISNLITNMSLTDAHTCFKVLPTALARQMELGEKRFAFDAELNVKISRLPKRRIYEVGISYYGRTFSEGKKIRLRDAFRTIYALLKYSLFSHPQPQRDPGKAPMATP